jgi:hypothetical protein
MKLAADRALFTWGPAQSAFSVHSYTVSQKPPLLAHTAIVKVQVKLSLCLTKHYTMKAYGGVDVEIHCS